MREKILKIIFWLAVLYVIVPIMMPIIYSFSEAWTGLIPKGFTLDWYKVIFSNPNYQPSLILSLFVASSATLLNIVLTVPAAYAVNRLRGKLAIFLEDTFKILPLIFPPLIVGLGLLQAFTSPPLAISGTTIAVIIAHTLLGLPFMFRNVYASLKTIDERTLSEAASSLGANLWQRMRYVIIPNIIPGILSGSLLVFAISFGEFEVTSMVAGFSSQTLPLILFQEMRNNFRIASAITAILVYVSLTAFMIIVYIGSKVQKGYKV